jgi:phage tail-like protein
MGNPDRDLLQRLNEATPVCRFYVQIGDMVQAVFSEVSGLNIEMAVEEIEEGGVNDFVHRLPGRCKVSNVTLKRGLTRTNELYKWVMEVAQGTIKRRNVSIVQYTTYGLELMRWNFREAYPVKWSGPQYRAGDNSNAIETLELAHKGLTMS